MQHFSSQKRGARYWLLCLVVALPFVLGACSLTTVPIQSSDSGGSAQQSATSTSNAAVQNTGSGSADSNGQSSGAFGPAPNNGSDNSGQNQQAGGAGAAWQVPAEQQAVVKVVEQVNPAVVTVVNQLDPRRTGFSGEARGSGVIVDNSGRIVTNNHVVAGAAQGGLQVIFYNGDSAPATLIGADANNDLAVLRVDAQVPTVATLADSSGIKVGETVIAIGSALGDFQNTVTVGVVSGMHRSLASDDPTQASMNDLIQTDAAINHGNSGGPLLNLSGQVIGINTAVVRGSGSGQDTDVAEGLGFAIPANTVKAVASRLINNAGKPIPYLGVHTTPVTRQIASYYQLKDTNGQLLNRGVLITEIDPNSGADQAGLQPGDVIVAANNTPLDANNTLGNLIAGMQVGDTITLQVVRDGQQLQVNAKLGQRPS
jgi:serine protease Do